MISFTKFETKIDITGSNPNLKGNMSLNIIRPYFRINGSEWKEAKGFSLLELKLDIECSKNLEDLNSKINFWRKGKYN